MEQSTQLMEEYISIYDKPKRGKGRPQGSKYTVEETAERARLSTMKFYHINIEKEKGKSRVYQARKRTLKFELLF